MDMNAFCKSSVSREGIKKPDGKQPVSMKLLPARVHFILTSVFVVYTEGVSER